MAEIISEKRSKGVQKQKKLSTRIDLTPMVDLGFLLITFFVFTTRISEPTALKLVFPKDADPTPLRASEALTLLLSKDNTIYYYEGQLQEDGSNLSKTNFAGIRSVIIHKKANQSTKNLMVIIKPYRESVYRNTVDALDEMTINEVKSYAIVDIEPSEEKLLALR